jgi:hypothetical protein
MIDQKDSYGMNTFARAAELQVQPLLKFLRGMVEIESPSDTKSAVDRCTSFVA